MRARKLLDHKNNQEIPWEGSMLAITIQRFLADRDAKVQRLPHPVTETLSQAARLCAIEETPSSRAPSC